MRIALATGIDIPHASADDDAPLLAELRRRGFECEVPAWQARTDWSAYDAVVIRSTWDYMDHLDAFLSWTRLVAGVTSLFNPPSLVAWNADKRYLRELAAAGAELAPTEWLAHGSSADLPSLLARHGWQRAFLKPAVGTGAAGTLRFDTSPSSLEGAQAFIDDRLPTSDYLLQPYLSRVETDGELSVIVIDGEISHAVRKRPRGGDYRVQDAWGGRDEREELAPEHRAEVGRAMDAIRHTAPGLDSVPPLYARIDMQWDDARRLALTEVEMVEPSLFFRHDVGAAARLADALERRLAGSA